MNDNEAIMQHISSALDHLQDAVDMLKDTPEVEVRDTRPFKFVLHEDYGVPLDELEKVDYRKLNDHFCDLPKDIQKLDGATLLKSAFVWSQTPQGHHYWSDLEGQIGRHGRVMDPYQQTPEDAIQDTRTLKEVLQEDYGIPKADLDAVLSACGASQESKSQTNSLLDRLMNRPPHHEDPSDIQGLFIWGATPQGHKFWSQVQEQLEDLGYLHYLPRGSVHFGHNGHK